MKKIIYTLVISGFFIVGLISKANAYITYTCPARDSLTFNMDSYGTLTEVTSVVKSSDGNNSVEFKALKDSITQNVITKDIIGQSLRVYSLNKSQFTPLEASFGWASNDPRDYNAWISCSYISKDGSKFTVSHIFFMERGSIVDSFFWENNSPSPTCDISQGVSNCKVKTRF